MICGCSVRYRPSASGRIPEAHSSCGVRQASAATTTARAVIVDRSPVATSTTSTPVARSPSSTTRRASVPVRSSTSGRSHRSPAMIAGPVQCRAPSSPTVTATGIAPTGRRCGRSNSSPEHPLHRAGQRRAVEGVRGDGQQLLGPGQRLVEDGGVDAVGHLVVHRPRAGRRPVRAHPADVRGHGRVRHGLRADQHRAGPGRRTAGQRPGSGGQLGQQAVALLGVGDVLDVPAGRVAQGLPGLEDDDPQAGLAVGQLAGDRRPDRAGADDQDVAVGGHRATAGSASSSRLSMSCWARIWSKAL